MSPPKKATESAAKLSKYQHLEAGEENGIGSSSPMDSVAEGTARVLEAISDKNVKGKSTLMGKIEEVKIDVLLIHQDMQKLRDRVTETETRISRVEDEVSPLQVTTERLQHQLAMVLAKQDNMENCLRRCNLHFVGLPEGSEGSDPPSFLENLLVTSFGRAEFSTTFVVERAHRLAAKHPPKAHHRKHL